jgi:hypothetical protein
VMSTFNFLLTVLRKETIRYSIVLCFEYVSRAFVNDRPDTSARVAPRPIRRTNLRRLS